VRIGDTPTTPAAVVTPGARLYARLGEEIRRLDVLQQAALLAAFEGRGPWARLPASVRAAFDAAAR
jgi:hypothetical protein